jgi:hypothetical protein
LLSFPRSGVGIPVATLQRRGSLAEIERQPDSERWSVQIAFPRRSVGTRKKLCGGIWRGWGMSEPASLVLSFPRSSVGTPAATLQRRGSLAEIERQPDSERWSVQIAFPRQSVGTRKMIEVDTVNIEQERDAAVARLRGYFEGLWYA